MVDNKKLGDIGEDIVAKYCEDLGFLVEKSESEYDQVKDMTIDGRTLEVKTQVPFVLKKCFSLKLNQLKKCQNVDYLMFVQAPCGKWDESALYQVDPKTFEFSTHRMKDNDVRYIIKINQPAVNKLCPIEGYWKEQLRRYATVYNG
jgi:hypothetical protein